jgi:hypothetical protein
MSSECVKIFLRYVSLTLFWIKAFGAEYEINISFVCINYESHSKDKAKTFKVL